ncbi:MAG: flagellar biosynthesis protein FliQ [Tepidisphaeraceae bacterium]
MSLDHAIELLRHTLVLTLLVAAPILLVGLVVGLVISLLQAVTQVQEQTLTFIPKIVAMFACAILLLPWISQHVVEYARVVFGEALMR